MVDKDTEQGTILAEVVKLLRRLVTHKKGEARALDDLADKVNELAMTHRAAPSGSQTESSEKDAP